MKKVALAFTILFGILTFAGAGYVLLHHGQVSAGYACVPMVLTLAAFTEYKKKLPILIYQAVPISFCGTCRKAAIAYKITIKLQL